MHMESDLKEKVGSFDERKQNKEALNNNKAPSHVLELDLHIRPVGSASGHMALLGDGRY